MGFKHVCVDELFSNTIGRYLTKFGFNLLRFDYVLWIPLRIDLIRFYYFRRHLVRFKDLNLKVSQTLDLNFIREICKF